MTIVKDLLTKEELRHLKRALEILPEDTAVSYEVWVIGYANNSKKEILLRTFEESREAIAYADTTYLLDAINAIAGNNRFDYSTDYVFVEVEAVIDNNLGGTINIGTVYKNNLFILEQIS
jgi:hypothetical protein